MTKINNEKEIQIVQYWVMDGRANYSIDNALVLVPCDTFDEAMKYINNYGDDTCIVKVTESNQELVYSLQQEIG